MQNYTYFKQFYQECLKQNVYFTLNLHKHQLYLLEQHSESFKIWSAIIRIKSLMMKLDRDVFVCVFQVILACVLVLMGEIFALIDFFSFTAWFFYGLTMLSLIVLRCTQKERVRPYKVSTVNKSLHNCLKLSIIILLLKYILCLWRIISLIINFLSPNHNVTDLTVSLNKWHEGWRGAVCKAPGS